MFGGTRALRDTWNKQRENIDNLTAIQSQHTRRFTSRNGGTQSVSSLELLPYNSTYYHSYTGGYAITHPVTEQFLGVSSFTGLHDATDIALFDVSWSTSFDYGAGPCEADTFPLNRVASQSEFNTDVAVDHFETGQVQAHCSNNNSNIGIVRCGQCVI